jgi:hypothetical protein
MVCAMLEYEQHIASGNNSSGFWELISLAGNK